MKYSRWIAILPVWLCAISVCISQNLVPNPSFETYTACPANWGNGGPMLCFPWVNGNLATADYFNTCATSTNVQIPNNLFGNQPAHTGNAYAGYWARESFIWREYLQVQLTQPLVAGFSYEVSFYVSLADLHCGVTHVGAYLSSTPPDPATIGPLAASPQIEANIGYVNDKDNWTLVTGCYAATGGEQYITIGNFYNNPSSPLDPTCSTAPNSYYYLDDVSVVQGDPVNTLPLELGPPVIACDSYTIDPGVSGVDFHWSDGSTGPTLTVTQSGTYSLTISSGCGNVGQDDIVVTINGSAAPVELGPPTATLCNGQNFSITLNPNAGDYTWQDGSTSPNYSITLPGLYQVTLDDGCDITTDQIEVTVLNPPAPFSLGNDATLCAGDVISYSFDPSLGNFLWQNNSTSPNFTINSAGFYYLTISNQCGEAYDDIVVMSAPQPTVDLGPAQSSLCAGQNIAFNLDPNVGSYEWQDGSTSPNYTISVAGTYAVTVTNGCGAANDQIIVNIIDPPAPFTLGNDAELCAGDNIVFNFDPSLGNFHWQDNSTSPNYTISTGGTYQLTISNTCGTVSDEIVVNNLPAPVVDLGPSQQTICEGQQINFNLDPAIGSYTWQDGSISSSYSISSPGIYAVTVTNTCGTMSDNIEVTMISEPVFDLGPDLVICPAQLPVLLDISNALNATSFHWQDNSSGAQLLVANAGTYAVTVSNTCFSVVDQIQVIVQNASPSVVLPADQSLCPGQTITIDGGGLIGNYVWQDGTTSASYIVSNPGTYMLTVTNQCGSGSDSITVNYYSALPSLDLGPDFSLCPGEQFALHANVSGVNYVWQDMSNNDSLVVSLPGIYSLQISNMCGMASDTVVVTNNGNPPVVDLPASITLCSGSITTIDAGISGVQYLWSDGSQGSSITTSNPGIYSLTVSNTCGIDSDRVVVVDAGPPPTVLLDADISICPGEIVLLSPVSSGVQSWLWQDGSTGSTFNVSSPGLITVQVSNNCGVNYDSINVALLPATPSLDLGVDTSLCPGEMLTLSINTPGVNITWLDGTNGVSYDVNGGGLFYATISNQCGSSSDSVDVSILPGIPQVNLGADQSLCPGESITLSPGISGVNYLWQDGSTATSFNATLPGFVILTLSNSCGSAIDSMEIIANTNGPQVHLGNDVSACIGDVVMLTSDVLGVNYLWQDGSTTVDFSTNVSGTFILQVSNACGVDADTVVVDISGLPPAPSLGPDTILCEGISLQLKADAAAQTSIAWQDGSTLPVMNVTSPGTYILTETNHCGVASDTIDILYQAAPAAFDLGPDTILCPDEFILILAPMTTDMMTWQDGSHDISMIADASQTYSLLLSNQCGQVQDSLAVRVDDRIPSIHIDDQILNCQADNITLDATQHFDASYLWNTGSTSPAIDVKTPGVYNVTVTTACQSIEQTVEVAMNKDCNHQVFIPNVFSPNGDQANEEFSISFNSTQDIASISCSIFDRWGNLVYNSKEINFRWDGRFKSDVVQSGVYAYLINVDYTDGENRMFKGDVTVIH